MSGILFPQIAKVFLVLTMGLPDAIILKDVMVDMDPPKFSVNFNQYFEGSLDIECLHIGIAFEHLRTGFLTGGQYILYFPFLFLGIPDFQSSTSISKYLPASSVRSFCLIIVGDRCPQMNSLDNLPGNAS